MSNKMHGVLLVLLALTVDIDPSSAACTTTCTRGELCKGDGCEECPDGYFQVKPKHQFSTCKQWSKKPPNEHWVKLSNGTSTSDIEWGCEEGYRVHEYAPSASECQSVPPSTPRPPSTTMSSTTETSTPLMESTTIPSGTVEDESGIGAGGIIGIVFGIVILVIIIVAVCVCWKKGLLCFATTSRNESYENRLIHVVLTNGPSDLPSSQLLPSQTSPEDQEKERKYESLVKQLGADDTKKLLHYLETNNFDVDNALSFNRERHPDPEKYRALTFLDWENKHPDLDHRECIKSALDNIGRGYLYPKIFPDLLNNGQRNSNSESPGMNSTGRGHVLTGLAVDNTEENRPLIDEKDVVPEDASPAPEHSNEHSDVVTFESEVAPTATLLLSSASHTEPKSVTAGQSDDSNDQTKLKRTAKPLVSSALHTEPKSVTSGQSDDSSNQTELKPVIARNSESSDEETEPKSVTAGGQVEPTSATVVNPTTKQIKKPEVNLFPLYYLLVDLLGPDDVTTLLYRLPSTNKTFNAKTSMRFKELSHKDHRTCLVETLSEWKEKNNIDNKSVIEHLKDILTEMQRNDVLESEEFEKCISDIGC